MSNRNNHRQKGFTLIELLVAVSLFVVVATIAVGALLVASQVNKRAQAIRMAMDNLNFALELMSTKLRQGGTAFYCFNVPSNTDPTLNLAYFDAGRNCSSGDNAIAVRYVASSGFSRQDKNVIFYHFKSVSGGRDTLKMLEENQSAVDLLAPELDLDELVFTVTQAERDPILGLIGAPKVKIELAGKAKVGREVAEFALQTTISERIKLRGS